ncbi:hypothetical protein [Neorhizobium sp. SOG26]|nr:hypothetical protein [Neorhizobium sp. SOG26]
MNLDIVYLWQMYGGRALPLFSAAITAKSDAVFHSHEVATHEQPDEKPG